MLQQRVLTLAVAREDWAAIVSAEEKATTVSAATKEKAAAANAAAKEEATTVSAATEGSHTGSSS